MMGEDEEHIVSGWSSSSSKKMMMKQKKVPQRGLGVAQLEKMISEEQQQQQKKGILLAKNINTNTNTNNSFLALAEFSNFNIPNIEIIRNDENGNGNGNGGPPGLLVNNIVSSSSEAAAAAAGFMSSSAQLGGGRHDHNWPKSWRSSTINSRGGDTMTPCHNFIGFDHSNIAHKFQRPPPPPPCSNSLAVMKSSHSVGISCTQIEMELPSIQSVRCKNYALTQEDNNKMIGGMKRSYPFSLELESPANITCTSSLQHSRRHAISSLSKSDGDDDDDDNQLAAAAERNPNELTTTDHNRRRLRLNGDFLTLAPPAAVASPPLDQEYGESQSQRAGGPSGLVENSFNFFPMKLQTYKTTAYISSSSDNIDGENRETIDLNLKL